MTEYASKDSLFEAITTEKDFTLPDGKVVRIRAMTRQQAHEISGMKSAALIEQAGISYGLAEPKLTRSEVERWMQAAPSGYFEELSKAITDLSGMTPDAEKVAYHRFPDGG